jgi:hypothetical protein
MYLTIVRGEPEGRDFEPEVHGFSFQYLLRIESKEVP